MIRKFYKVSWITHTMNEKQKRHSRIVKCFAREIYMDIALSLAILALAIYIPFCLAQIFSPGAVAEYGLILTTLIWLMMILIFITIGYSIIIAIHSWVDARWEKAKKSVENKNGRK